MFENTDLETFKIIAQVLIGIGVLFTIFKYFYDRYLKNKDDRKNLRRPIYEKTLMVLVKLDKVVQESYLEASKDDSQRKMHDVTDRIQSLAERRKKESHKLQVILDRQELVRDRIDLFWYENQAVTTL